MSRRSFRRTAQDFHNWCADVHTKQPNECVVVHFDGPWVLEISPRDHDDPPVNILTDWRLMGFRIRDLMTWLIKHNGFEGLEGREDDFEWRLYRGAY